MPNSYTGFSFKVCENPTKEERDWWDDSLDLYAIEEAGYPEPFEDEYVNLLVESSSDSIIVYSPDDNGDVDQAAEMVQRFINKFRPDLIVAFQWAEWCDRSSLNSFGGGGVVITSSSQDFFDTTSVLEAKIKGNNND